MIRQNVLPRKNPSQAHVRYRQMFEGFLKYYEAIVLKLNGDYHTSSRSEIRHKIETEIKRIRKTLETDEQRVYALRFFRANIMFPYLSPEEINIKDLDPQVSPETIAEFVKERKKLGAYYRQITREQQFFGAHGASGFTIPYGTFMVNVTHYMDNARIHGYTKVLRFKFEDLRPRDVLDNLGRLEGEYEDLARQKKLAGFVPWNESLKKHTLFLELDSKWAWYANVAGFCDATAKAMGHCGNANPKKGDVVLNLGEKVKGGYRPHLTFILNNGILGEMKGRFNEKPQAKYHDCIICLLLDDRVQHVHGGGYLEENNFSPKDLDKEVLAKLEKKKPQLFDIDEFVDKAPFKILDGLVEALNVPNILHFDSESGKAFIADKVFRKDGKLTILGYGPARLLKDMEEVGFIADAESIIRAIEYSEHVELNDWPKKDEIEWRDLYIDFPKYLKRIKSTSGRYKAIKGFEAELKKHFQISEDGELLVSKEMLDVARTSFGRAIEQTMADSYVSAIDQLFREETPCLHVRFQNKDGYFYGGSAIYAEGDYREVLAQLLEAERRDESVCQIYDSDFAWSDNFDVDYYPDDERWFDELLETMYDLEEPTEFEGTNYFPR